MANYSICNEWYNEIKGLVPMANPEFITEGPWTGQVEVDVLDEVKFEQVSKELGWM